jgi:hypothetical protein
VVWGFILGAMETLIVDNFLRIIFTEKEPFVNHRDQNMWECGKMTKNQVQFSGLYLFERTWYLDLFSRWTVRRGIQKWLQVAYFAMDFEKEEWNRTLYLE